MPSENIPSLSIGARNSEDRATAAILAKGGADGVTTFALRQWRSGIPRVDSTAPVFVTWLLGMGRFCLTVQYGRHSLKGTDWHIETRAGL